MQSFKSNQMLNINCGHDGGGDTYQDAQEHSFSPGTLDNKQSVTVSAPRRRQSSVLRNEKRRKKLALQRVISVRQEKIYEQQCEIEELRRRIRDVCNDNKFLREQNYWQSKALEKLDGKHAELPQLINGHLEEIRVFREQIRRIKEVLKLEKQRRHDAEGAKEKAIFELKHLRKLAEEHKLVEKEELMQTISKLEAENEEKAKHMSNLERYAENLEKNQRFESQRYARTQKEMRETCRSLLDRIHQLEQTVQEKQKVIELGNIYSKRIFKSQILMSQHIDSDMGSQECAMNTPETATTPEGDHPRTTFRDRMKEFDQRRQDMERKRDKVRKKRTTLVEMERISENDADEPTACDEAIADGQDSCSYQAVTDIIVADVGDHKKAYKMKGKHSPVILPKIHSNESSSSSRETNGKRNRCTHEAKQVRFSAPLQITENHMDGDFLFHELQNSERMSRLIAEANLERELATMNKGTAENKADGTSSNPHSELMLRLKVIDRLGKPPAPSTQYKTKQHGQRSSGVTSSPAEVSGPDSSRSPGKSSVNRGVPAVGENATKATHTTPEITTNGVQTSEILSNSSVCRMASNSPRRSRTTSELSTLDSFELYQPKDTAKQPCRPCGDHDIDDFLSEETTGGSRSGSDMMGTGGEEEYMWQETPSVMTSSPTNKMTPHPYRGPDGLIINDGQEVSGVDVEYIAQATFGFVTNRHLEHHSAITSKNNLPLLNCSTGTKTLYTLCNQKTEGSE